MWGFLFDDSINYLEIRFQNRSVMLLKPRLMIGKPKTEKLDAQLKQSVST